MLYDRETKIVSFEKIDVFPRYRFKNDDGIRVAVYVQRNDFYELEALHLANLSKVPDHFGFGAYFPNESVFVYDSKGDTCKNVDAFDILWKYKYINVTASFKIIQVDDEIKGVSYPIISGHELKIYIFSGGNKNAR